MGIVCGDEETMQMSTTDEQNHNRNSGSNQVREGEKLRGRRRRRRSSKSTFVRTYLITKLGLFGSGLGVRRRRR